MRKKGVDFKQGWVGPFCNEMFVNGAPQTALLFKLEYALSHSGRRLWLIRSCASFWNARTLTMAGATAGVNGPPYGRRRRHTPR